MSPTLYIYSSYTLSTCDFYRCSPLKTTVHKVTTKFKKNCRDRYVTNVGYLPSLQAMGYLTLHVCVFSQNEHHNYRSDKCGEERLQATADNQYTSNDTTLKTLLGLYI